MLAISLLAVLLALGGHRGDQAGDLLAGGVGSLGFVQS